MLNTSLLGAMNSLLNQVWNDMVAVVVSQSVTDRLIAIRIGRQSEFGSRGPAERRGREEKERRRKKERKDSQPSQRGGVRGRVEDVVGSR